MRSRLNQGLLSTTVLSIDRNSNGIVLNPSDLYTPTIRGFYGTIYLSSNPYYNNLINLESNEIIIYVDQTNGKDTNTGLSPYQPLQTFDAANNLRFTTYSTNNAKIVIFPGTYTGTARNVSVNAGTIFSDDTGGYTKYICSPGQVTISFTSTQRDVPLAYFNSTLSAVYGAIIKRNNNGRTTSYSTAFFDHTSSKFSGSFYNCAIEETNANYNWSMSYDNSLLMTGTVNNCTFATREISALDYSSTSTFTVNNCVFNWTYTTTPTTGVSPTYNNPVVLAAHDLNFTTYAASGVTTAGVYSGNYAWPI